jgi:hypothetical protein
MSDNIEERFDADAFRAIVEKALSDPRRELIRAMIGIWADDPTGESTLPDPPSTIIFPDATIRYRDCELVDLRLEMLLEFGMPRDASRVIQRYNGDFFGKKYMNYTVDVLSVSLNEVSNPKGDTIQTGGVSYYRRNDGQVGVAQHWLRRLSRDGVVSSIEDVWHPKLGWLTITSSNEHHYRLVYELKALSDGIPCLRMVPADHNLGRSIGSGEIDNIPTRQMERILTYLCAYHKFRSDYQQILANYFDVSRWTISRYFQPPRLNWKQTLRVVKEQVASIPQDSYQRWRSAYEDGKNPIDF